MIKLTLKKDIIRYNFSKNISDSFSKKHILFFRNKKDKRNILLTFIICDYKKNIWIYLDSFLDSNIEILEKLWVENNKLCILWPHSVVECIEWESFYVFVEKTINTFPYFYYIDYKKNELFIVTLNDFKINWLWEVWYISATNFKTNNNTIILSINTNKQNILIEVNINNIEENSILYEKKWNFDNYTFFIHTLKEYNWMIFWSQFDKVEIDFSNKQNNLLLNKLYFTYKKIKDRNIYLLNDIKILKIFDKYFWSIIDKKKISNAEQKISFLINDLLDFVSFANKTIFKVKLVIWEFYVFNKISKKFNCYNTTFWGPAHFEIDEEDNYIYTSSHNNIRGRRSKLFFGPACIDKFKIDKNWILKNEWSFISNSWFRFTSHKLFACNWEKYFCTIWEPNRLFFIKCKTMELEYYYDLWENKLVDNIDKNIVYLNSSVLTNQRIALYPSDNNYIINIVWSDNLILFNFITKKIIHKEQILFDNNYEMFVTHIDTIK